MSTKESFSARSENSGSSNSDEPEFLAVGRLRRPHGVWGEIVMSVWTDFPERLVPGEEVFVGEEHHPLIIRSVRWHRKDILISFEEYSVREEVGLLRNQVLTVRAESLPPLEEGEFYLHQLIGMSVIDDDKGTAFGEISEILETGANDVYVVRTQAGSELLLPAIDSVILKIDFEKKEVLVHLLPGLLPEDG